MFQFSWATLDRLMVSLTTTYGVLDDVHLDLIKTSNRQKKNKYAKLSQRV